MYIPDFKIVKNKIYYVKGTHYCPQLKFDLTTCIYSHFQSKYQKASVHHETYVSILVKKYFMVFKICP